ncbi:hypothetical protein AEST_21520 [Alishewanella aestuarii B11]|uniref:Uncharacterized protein n=1 Tax=Alishewanella aestuarii B11 TaxID=1197174 RepID=J1YB47_9ALTE|nr:hypothetical protein AEST_21520 [Alishewanella aestuarii B11]
MHSTGFPIQNPDFTQFWRRKQPRPLMIAQKSGSTAPASSSLNGNIGQQLE